MKKTYCLQLLFLCILGLIGRGGKKTEICK